MKINIEDYLQKIDNSFNDKSQKDIYMTYFMIFSVIFAFAYLLFWDLSLAGFESKRAEVVSIEKKIQSDNRFLSANPDSKITHLTNQIQSAQNKMLLFKDNNQYIKTKIEEISSLIYDEQTWGKYLYSISNDAKTNKLKVISFANQYTQSKSSFGHILDVNISTTGNYKNTINFINSIEQSDLVVDIHSLELQAGSKISTQLNISVWGITY